MLLNVKDLKKNYITKISGNKVEAIKGIDFTVDDGEYIAIMGESGSGKTTLLNILAGLDKPTSGEVILNGKNIVEISENDICDYRRNHLGFVFQDFNLLDSFNVKDNIFLPLVLSHFEYKEMENRLNILSKKLGIEKLLNKYPYELSGGQKQRVAVTRALIINPDLVLADEPTGALDSKSSNELLDLFTTINKNGQTIIMVTHSIQAASHADRVLFIKDGKLFHQIYRGDKNNHELYQVISDTLSVLANGGEQNE